MRQGDGKWKLRTIKLLTSLFNNNVTTSFRLAYMDRQNTAYGQSSLLQNTTSWINYLDTHSLIPLKPISIPYFFLKHLPIIPVNFCWVILLRNVTISIWLDINCIDQILQKYKSPLWECAWNGSMREKYGNANIPYLFWSFYKLSRLFFLFT